MPNVRVFVVYASADGDKADRLVSWLHGHKVRVMRADDNIEITRAQTRTEWPEYVQKGLLEADRIIALCSTAFRQSSHCVWELNRIRESEALLGKLLSVQLDEMDSVSPLQQPTGEPVLRLVEGSEDEYRRLAKALGLGLENLPSTKLMGPSKPPLYVAALGNETYHLARAAIWPFLVSHGANLSQEQSNYLASDLMPTRSKRMLSGFLQIVRGIQEVRESERRKIPVRGEYYLNRDSPPSLLVKMPDKEIQRYPIPVTAATEIFRLAVHAASVDVPSTQTTPRHDSTFKPASEWDVGWVLAVVALMLKDTEETRGTEAEPCFRFAIRLLSETPSDLSSTLQHIYAEAIASFGLYLGNSGRYSEALTCYTRALEHLSPEQSTVVEFVEHYRGNALRNLGRLRDARLAYARALNAGRNRSKVTTEFDDALALRGIGSHRKASEALAERTRSGKEVSALGRILNLLGESDKSLEYHREVGGSLVTPQTLPYFRLDHADSIRSCIKRLQLSLVVERAGDMTNLRIADLLAEHDRLRIDDWFRTRNPSLEARCHLNEVERWLLDFGLSTQPSRTDADSAKELANRALTCIANVRALPSDPPLVSLAELALSATMTAFVSGDIDLALRLLTEADDAVCQAWAAEDESYVLFYVWAGVGLVGNILRLGHATQEEILTRYDDARSVCESIGVRDDERWRVMWWMNRASQAPLKRLASDVLQQLKS